MSRLADSILGFIFISCVGRQPTEAGAMRLPILLSDIVLVFCLAAFIAGLMIAAASLLS